VLIVGAGLAGATAAFELSRAGVSVRIVDERPAPAAAPDTLTLHARTLDLLERRGLDPRTLNGNHVADAAVYWKRNLVGTIPLAQASRTRREFLLANRADVERALRELLTGQGVAVEYSTTLIAFCGGEPGLPEPPDEADQGVRAILRHSDGRLEEVKAPYLVSADGTQGALRHLPGLPADVKRAGRSFLLADVCADGDLPADQVCVFLGPDGYLAVFPLGGNRFQCVATEPRPTAGRRGIAATDELQKDLRRDVARAGAPAGGELVPPDPGHGTARRRDPPPWPLFLGGESAHAYRAASTQAVNSGVQDMINLSWKLAMVLGGLAVPELLDTYGAERQRVIREVSRRADLARHARRSGQRRAPAGRPGRAGLPRRAIHAVAGRGSGRRGVDRLPLQPAIGLLPRPR
jgi:2-polyprenyl-6-methoxyphenol hydroxylase-like FAD-dependent oxidoreductase